MPLGFLEVLTNEVYIWPLATQLLAEFGFSQATLKPEIFDHRTTNS